MISFTKFSFAALVAVLLLPSQWMWASPQSESIPERPTTELILPETTVALVQIPNFRDALEKMRQTAGGQMMADQSIAPLVDGLWEEAETSYEDVKDKVGLELSDLTSLPAGEITFAVIAPRRQTPEYLVMMDLNADDGVLDRVMDRGRELIAETETEEDESETEPEEFDSVDGFEIESFRVNGRKVHFFRHDQTVVACTSLSELNDLIQRWMGQEVEKTRPLSANRRYATIMKRCEGTNDLDPEFRFFVDPIAVAKSSTIGNPSARLTINLLPLFGFDSLSAIGGTMFLDEEDYEAVMHGHVLLTNPRTGIFALLAFKPTDYEPEPFIPQTANNHSMVSLDAPKGYAELTKIVDSYAGPGYFEKIVQENINDDLQLDLKEDIINTIDGRITWFQWIEEPAMRNSNRNGIVIRLKDPAKFEMLLDKITEKANGDFAGGDSDEDSPQAIEKREYRDVTIYAEPRSKIATRNEQRERRINRRNKKRRRNKEGEDRPRMEASIESPQMAIFGDCLVISVDSNRLLEVLIDTHLGEGDALADDEGYARIVEESQKLLNNELPIANFYSDPKKQLKWLLDLVNTDTAQKVLEGVGQDNKYISGIKRRLDENPLPEFDQIGKYFNQTGGFFSDDDTGVHMLFFTLKSEEE